MAYKLISFTVRAGLAGSFIYWTKEEGFWGDSKKSTELYQKACANTKNLLRDVPVQIPSISVPKPYEIGAFLRVNWNKAIYATFDGIIVAPRKIQEWSCKGWTSVVKMINEPPKPAST